MIKRFKDFKKLNEAEVDSDGNLVDFKVPELGTKENPIEITSEEYMYLTYPEFVGQTRVDQNGDFKMLWRVGETHYLTKGNIYD
jgi:hypothetical protein